MEQNTLKEISTRQRDTIDVSTSWPADDFDALRHLQERLVNKLLNIENVEIPYERLLSSTGLILGPTFVLKQEPSRRRPSIRR